jgi:hypothetical protein
MPNIKPFLSALILSACSFSLSNLYAATYFFPEEGKKRAPEISKVIFSNGDRIEEKWDKLSGGKIELIEKNKKYAQEKISNDHVGIVAAFPSYAKAKVAIVSEFCGGSACGEVTYWLVVLRSGNLQWHSFRPEGEFKIVFNIVAGADPVVKVDNMTGFNGLDEYGDRKVFGYKYLDNAGFVHESFDEKFSKLVSGQIDFFSDKTLREPLYRVLKTNQFAELRSFMDMAREDLVYRGRYIFIQGCKAHDCGDNQGSVIIDAVNGGIWTVWVKKREKEIYFNSTIPWTQVALDTLHLTSTLFTRFDSSEDEKQLVSSLKEYLTKELELAISENRKNQDKLEEKNERTLVLQIFHTEPLPDGSLTINIQTNTDTASLLINGEEQGSRTTGDYVIKKIARAGTETTFTIKATDITGNTDTKVISVKREVVGSEIKFAALNPAQVKKQPERDAVAIIIGIADYKNLPRADFANDDARVFYDYAIRALGVKSENIKLLVDTDADQIEIYRAFKTWLPSRVRASTDVYVYYSGHGLPTADGQGLYLLPQRADRDFIDKTAITQVEINAAIQAAKPRSVTMFLDACYSGQARTGETLVASARPVALKVERQLFPDSFTVISASQVDQISSSSPDLKHGIFSYYLMRGMEGDADANRDGKITAGEMHTYLMEQVARQAGMMNRKQEPQLTGDANRVLVGR